MKFYAVRVGRTPGIYSTWESCAAQVKGYPGAVYKSFKTRKEAQMFLDNVVKDPNSSNKKQFPSSSSATNVDIWVDGSCIHNGGGEDMQLGWAYLIRKEDQELHRANGNDIPPEASQHRNVAGEILAVLKALDWCDAQGITSATIYFDYQGLQAWVSGAWEARTPYTKAYVESVKAHGIDIQWEKVLAHSGEIFNEIVDEMAREAARARN
jgi:ribonuclease HI